MNSNDNPETTVAEQFTPQLAHHFGEKGYAVMDHFLSAKEVFALLEQLQQQKEAGEMRRAGIGHKDDYQLNQKVRGDHILWIDQNDAAGLVRQYLDHVNNLLHLMNRTCYLGLKDFEVHFTWYPAGTYYKRHIDNFRKIGNRLVSFICYLNENWQPGDGGELRIYSRNEDGTEYYIDVQPTAGKMVLLLSEETEHEVLMAHRPRYSLTGWMLKQPKGLGFL